MSLTTAEKFLILAHHPEKSRYVLADQMRSAGLIGAILMDLSAEERLSIEDGRIKVKSTNTRLPDPHRAILRKIQSSSRPKKARSWISRLAQAPGKYRKAIQLELERKGIMKIERKRFLFISYLQTSLIKSSVRQQIIMELREIVFNNKEVDNNNAMMLGLVQACKMHKVICRNREEIKHCRAKLKGILEKDIISGEVEKVIREMNAALAGALVASTAATTAAAH